MIKHQATVDAQGNPIYYYTLEQEEIETMRANQTEEQKKMNDWLERLWKEKYEIPNNIC